jgi:hypothetical protein
MSEAEIIPKFGPMEIENLPVQDLMTLDITEVVALFEHPELKRELERVAIILGTRAEIYNPDNRIFKGRPRWLGFNPYMARDARALRDLIHRLSPHFSKNFKTDSIGYKEVLKDKGNIKSTLIVYAICAFILWKYHDSWTARLITSSIIGSLLWPFIKDIRNYYKYRKDHYRLGDAPEIEDFFKDMARINRQQQDLSEFGPEEDKVQDLRDKFRYLSIRAAQLELGLLAKKPVEKPPVDPGEDEMQARMRIAEARQEIEYILDGYHTDRNTPVPPKNHYNE